MRYLLALAALVTHLGSEAANVVVYVNGGSKPAVEDTTEQASRFMTTMLSNGVPESFEFKYFPVAQSDLESGEAILCQRELSREAFPVAGSAPAKADYPTYYRSLGRLYEKFLLSSLANFASCVASSPLISRLRTYTEALAAELTELAKGSDTITLVGYSQGNNYIEAALAYMLHKGDIASLDRFRFVGIASPAFTGDRHVNVTLDQVVYGTPGLGSPYSLPPTDTICVLRCEKSASLEEIVNGGGSSNVHFLFDNYLNPFFRSLERSLALPAVIANEILGATSSPGGPPTSFTAPPHAVPYQYAGNTYTWITQAQASSTTSYVFYCKDSIAEPTIDFNAAGPSAATQIYLRFGGTYASAPTGACVLTTTTDGGTTWNSNIVIDGYFLFGNPEFNSFQQFRSHRSFTYNGFPFDGYTNANFGVLGIATGSVLITGSSFTGMPLPFVETFSRDPGWMTDQPSNFFWDSTSGTYRARVTASTTNTKPTRYAVLRGLPFDPNRGFSLSWDRRINADRTRGYMCFGLFSDALETGPSSTVSLCTGLATSTLEFHTLAIFGTSGSSLGQGGSNGREIQLGKWYRYTLTYDPGRSEVQTRVVDLSTGLPTLQTSFTRSVPVGTTFDTGMNVVGIASDNRNEHLPPESDGFVDAEIDNVSLAYIAPSAPTYNPTLSLSPRLVPLGGSTTLTWNTGGAPISECTLARGGTQLPAITATSGSLVVSNVQGRTTYTLTCGTNAASATVEIVPVVQ